jgi:hypothetical protein
MKIQPYPMPTPYVIIVPASWGLRVVETHAAPRRSRLGGGLLKIRSRPIPGGP